MISNDWIEMINQSPKENQDVIFISNIDQSPHYGTYKNKIFVVYYRGSEYYPVEVARWYPVPKPYK